jgi:hypothetical protein
MKELSDGVLYMGTDQNLDFLDELDNMDTDYEVEKFDSDEDEGCEGGACKI